MTLPENRLLRRALETGEVVGPDLECTYYPCHFPGQDCTFCFCPLYPCGEKAWGGKMVKSRAGGLVWSCEDCLWVHRPEDGRRLLRELTLLHQRYGGLHGGELRGLLLKLRGVILEKG